MSTLMAETAIPLARDVRINEEGLTVDLADGRTITVPTLWYPRLSHGTKKERSNWQIIAGGEGIHWPDLDEDISIEGLLAGRASGESPKSFKKWLEKRGKAASGR